MAFLLDTNVLSELRKGKRANPNVVAWAKAHLRERTYISVLSIGEIRKGIELLRARDPKQCPVFEKWVTHLMDQYQDDTLPFNVDIVERWGRLNAQAPMPVIDSLIAASALEYRLTVVTRNIREFIPAEVPAVNPFQAPSDGQ